MSLILIQIAGREGERQSKEMFVPIKVAALTCDGLNRIVWEIGKESEGTGKEVFVAIKVAALTCDGLNGIVKDIDMGRAGEGGCGIFRLAWKEVVVEVGDFVMGWESLKPWEMRFRI